MAHANPSPAAPICIVWPIVPGQPAPNYQLVLDEIEAKLIPEVDSELTLANLDKCKQKPEEDIPAFHARLVYYWLRAHPMHNVDVAETDQLLIRHFIKGLACDNTKKQTLDHWPATMAEALREAEHVHGTNVLLTDDPPKGVEAQGVQSVQEVSAPGKCLACDRTGHPQVTSMRAGADLHVLGETKEPLIMKLKHTSRTYTTRPAIIRGMHSVFNLSGPWLKTMGWDDLHSQGCLMIDGQPVPLVHHTAAAPQVSEVYVISKVTIAPRMGQAVEVVVPDIRGRQTIPGPGCTELNERMKKARPHTGPHVYHKADQGGLATVPVLNLTD